MRFESLLQGPWVLGIEGACDGTDGVAAEVRAVLRQFSQAGLRSWPPGSLVVMEPEQRVADAEATLAVEYLPHTAFGTDAEQVERIYRLRALTPGDDANRRALLRARNEAFCAAADVIVVCGSQQARAMDPAHYTLRMALAGIKPVIWIETRPDGRVVWRFSKAMADKPVVRHANAAALGRYMAAVEQLLNLRDTDPIEQWHRELDPLFSAGVAPPADASAFDALAQWWAQRVEPAFDPDAALAHDAPLFPVPEAHSHSGAHAKHAHDDERSPGATLRRIRQMEVHEAGVHDWTFRVAGSWHMLFSSLVIDVLSLKGRGLLKFLKSPMQRWVRACFGATSLNRSERNFSYSGAAAAATAAPLHDSERIGRVFDIADERAMVEGGRYRSALWLGYLLSIVAVLAAAWGAVGHDAEHPAASSSAHAAGLLWALGMFLLALLAMGWKRAAPVLQRLWPRCSVAGVEESIWRLGIAYLVFALFGAAWFLLRGGLPAMATVEILALASILVLVSVMRTLNAHARWLAARAFAEAVRYDQMLLPGLALSRMSRQAAFRIDGKGLHLNDGLSWWLARARAIHPLPSPRRAAADAGGAAPSGPASSPASGAATGAVSLADRRYLHWYIGHLLGLVSGQVAYHVGRAERENAFHHRMHSITGVLFASAVFSAMAHVLHLPSGADWQLAWTFLTIALPVTAAGLHAINAQIESARHAQASESMLDALAPAIGQLEVLQRELDLQLKAGDTSTVPWPQVAQVRRLAAVMADAMMADVADWFRLVAAQPLTVPA